jgi:NAD(P)-dependent dehydrogenase (short-subunit alcohol dehydrogenase family)
MPTVIVTGGTKGLGREMALAFGSRGYCVVALYSHDELAARECSDLLAARQISGLVLRHDVTSDEAAIWNRAEIQGADGLTLINNACATFSPMPMHQLAWPDFERAFLVAVKGAWSCSRPLLKLMMAKKRGTIVNVLTSAITGPPPKGFAAYLTAKFALRGLTLALAAEYAARGIKIFSISPGYMDTPLTQSWDPRLQDAIRKGSECITLPAEAAARTLALAEDPAVPGQGEDYPV